VRICGKKEKAKPQINPVR